MLRGNIPPILLTIIAGSCLFMINRFYPPTCKKSLRAPRPLLVIARKESLMKIPRRFSNYTVLTSSMAVRPGDIPAWLSCPPAQTSHSIWSMAVTEKEALYSSVAAVSIKVIKRRISWHCKDFTFNPAPS